MKGPETGQRAPDFTLPWASREAIGPEEQPFRLTDNLGKVVVLAFFARDFTPGSIAELQGLAAVADSSGPEVVVVAISSDSLETHRRFANSIGIKYLLLSDPDQRVARRYGSDGADGVDRPTVYVIKPDGKVSYRDLGLEPAGPARVRVAQESDREGGAAMRCLMLAAVLTSLAAPLAAQGGLQWKFTNLQQGYCINFLVSPSDAPRLIPGDAQPVRLDAMTDAPPALLRVLQDQPEYGSWMPAAVCIYRFGRADGGNRELVAAAGESEMVGVIAFGARVTANQPANGLSASVLFTNDKRIEKGSDSTRVSFRRVKATFGKAAHGDDERHVISLGKTTLIWDGHAASDSTVLTAPLERVLVFEGSRNKPVLLRWTLSATSSRSMVGALVIQGKDRLAKVMRSSPIRYLGPIYQGGRAELSELPD